MTRERFHAISLAAIMLLSVVAIGAGFAGGAAAQEAGQDKVVLLDASGDETGDSFDTIQAAVDDANEGFTVVVGSGTYEESVTVDVSGVTVRAADDAHPEIDGIVTAAASGVTVDGLTIDGESRNAAPLDVQAGGVTISNNTVTGGSDAGGISTWGGPGPIVGHVSIRDNTIENGPIGLAVDSESTDIDIRNNEISGASSEGIWLSDYTDGTSISEADITIRNNDISDVALADVKIERHPPKSLNGDEELADPSAVAESFLDDSNAEAVQLWDGQVYNENGNIVVQDGDSIQAAIDAAESGDSIDVYPGTYEEDAGTRAEGAFGLYVGTDDLTIRGVTAEGEPISDPTNVQAEVISTNSSTFGTNGPFVAADDTTIQGLEITPDPDSSPNKNLEVTGDNLTLDSNVINGDIGSVYFNTGGVQSFSVVNNQISAGLSVNNGVGNESNPENRIVENNDVGLISFAGEQPDVAWRNHAVGAVTIEDNTIRGHSYTLEYKDDSGTTQTYLYEGVVKRVGTVTEPTDFRGVFDHNTVLRGSYVENGSEPTGVENLGTEESPEYQITYSAQESIDTATDGKTVVVKSGTYDENVTVDTPNVSVIGQGDDTVINGLVYLSAENVTLANVAVEPDEFVRPDGEDGLPNDEKQAILITASNVSVYGSTIDVSLDANGAFEEVNAIQVFGDDSISGVQIVDNDITGTASNDEVAGVVGVSDQAETEETFVFNNSISVDSEGYSFGVVTRASGGSNVEETPETVVVYNDIDATADAYPGVGYGIESTDEAQVDANAQVVKDNTFGDVDAIQHKADGGTLDVTMNEWEDLENVSFKTDGYPDAYHNGGEIDYDPFLTASPNASDFSRPGERTNFGHDLVVPADGEPHSVAFPAAVDGSVDEVFSEFDGTVYAYDGDEWESGEEIADEDVDALDAFVVSVDENEDDLRIDFAYAETDSPVPSMTTAELEAGWNFVGAPTGNTPSDEAFAGSTAEITTVIDAIAGPSSETTPYGLDASPDVTNPDRVSPFKGYWVFVTDDGELGATVPVEPTQETEEGALTGN